jgi:hypothetical protein
VRIDEDVALFAHDLLAGVVTRRIDAGPKFAHFGKKLQKFEAVPREFPALFARTWL